MTESSGGPASSFDDLVGRLPTPMALVTTVDGDERAGCLVGFHCQCGIEPRRYAVWLSRANRTFEVAADAEWFAVHLLGAGDHDLAEQFGGQTGDDVDKFAGVDWHPGPGGVPVIDRVADRFVGRRVDWEDGDTDHVCVMLEPVEVVGGEGRDWLLLDAVTDIEPGHEADERRPDA